MGFGEGDGGLAESGERGGGIGVFFLLLWLWWWGGGVQSRWLAGVANCILARYDAPVLQARGDVVREITAHSRYHRGSAFIDPTHEPEEIDGGFETAGE